MARLAINARINLETFDFLQESMAKNHRSMGGVLEQIVRFLKSQKIEANPAPIEESPSKEIVVSKPKAPARRQSYSIPFEIFWKAGLNSQDKKGTLKSFNKACSESGMIEADFALMLEEDITKRIINDQLGIKNMHTKTYLNQSRWEGAHVDQAQAAPKQMTRVDLISAKTEESGNNFMNKLRNGELESGA